MGLQWDYRTHPSFFDFACGLMALPHTPDYLRDDPEAVTLGVRRKGGCYLRRGAKMSWWRWLRTMGEGGTCSRRSLLFS